jgi:hypothetical protein
LLIDPEPGAATPLHILSQRPHRLLRYRAALSSTYSGFGFINRGKYFRAASLALFPQRESFPDSIVFVAKATALDGLADKGLLILGEVYLHAGNLRITRLCAGPALFQETPNPLTKPRKIFSFPASFQSASTCGKSFPLSTRPNASIPRPSVLLLRSRKDHLHGQKDFPPQPGNSPLQHSSHASPRRRPTL